MSGLSLNGSYSNSTYFDSSSGIQSINMIGASTKFNDTTVSVGVGNDSSYKDGKIQSSNPFFECKVKQNFNDNLNAQFRFRESGGTEQYRVTFGGNYALDNQNSIYGAAHATAKDTNGNWKYSTGVWVGYTHTFSNGISTSVEAQQNVPLNGTSPNLTSFNDGNKSVNVFVTIPF